MPHGVPGRADPTLDVVKCADSPLAAPGKTRALVEQSVLDVGADVAGGFARQNVDVVVDVVVDAAADAAVDAVVDAAADAAVEVVVDAAVDVVDVAGVPAVTDADVVNVHAGTDMAGTQDAVASGVVACGDVVAALGYVLGVDTSVDAADALAQASNEVAHHSEPWTIKKLQLCIFHIFTLSNNYYHVMFPGDQDILSRKTRDRMWWKLSCLRSTTVQVLKQLVLVKGIIENP